MKIKTLIFITSLNWFNSSLLFSDSYKKMPLETKGRELINEIKEMIALYINIVETYEIDYEILKSKEIIDIKDGDYTTDDYLEALYVYLNVLKNVTVCLINNLIDINC